MKTFSFADLESMEVTPCCGHRFEDVQRMLSMFHDSEYEIALCECGCVVKIDWDYRHFTLMERAD